MNVVKLVCVGYIGRFEASQRGVSTIVSSVPWKGAHLAARYLKIYSTGAMVSAGWVQ